VLRQAIVSSGMVAIALLGPLISAGCGKRCDTADGCNRTCTCNDTANSLTYSCAMTFNCDQDAKTCDPGHDLSCDEICETYAAKNACGRQCINDEQCVLRCDCEVEGGGSIPCQQAFACNKDVGTCEPTHAATTCEALCSACYVGP